MHEYILFDAFFLYKAAAKLLQGIGFILLRAVRHQNRRFGKHPAKAVDNRLAAVVAASRMHI